jgi:malate dehydrogenase (oxaloacetate-decarboxylating)(NADP+)
MMLKRGEADAMICGTYGQYREHLGHVLDIIGKAEGILDVSALSTLVMPTGTFFLCDTHVTYDPTAEELVEMTLLAAEAVIRHRRYAVGAKDAAGGWHVEGTSAGA